MAEMAEAPSEPNQKDGRHGGRMPWPWRGGGAAFSVRQDHATEAKVEWRNEGKGICNGVDSGGRV